MSTTTARNESQPAPQHPDWRQHCAALGLDAEEVGMVASRYRAYAGYMAQRGGGMDLDAWFRFYLFEKRSESGYQSGAPVSGCSAQGEATGQSSVDNPAGFLEVLKLHLAADS
jgi:hypothetical protein